MKLGLFSERIFGQIRVNHRAGNHNTAACLALEHAESLAPVFPELIRMIRGCLDSPWPALSEKTASRLAAARWLPWDLRERLGAYRRPKTPALAGAMEFPCATSIGHMGSIRVGGGRTVSLDFEREHIFDVAGAAVTDVLERRACCELLWDPWRFCFSVLDANLREDRRVKGDSFGLALCLCLYSFMTGTAPPSDVSASARVARNGAILPVSGIAVKMEVLGRERPGIRRLLISRLQDLPEAVAGPGPQPVAVDTLDEAVRICFPEEPAPAALNAPWDLDAALRTVQRQYSARLIEPCLENVARLKKYLESDACPLPSEDIVRGVFLCLFRQGACLRLLGELSAAERKLLQAERLYLKNSGIIYESFYFNALSCRAKVLRDCFRYREAERLHMKVDAEFAADGVNHDRGKNLSALATLYLAVGDLEKAARCEKQALRLVRSDCRAINHGFLCRICARAKQFSKADYHLRKARTLTPEAPFWLRRHFRQTTDLFAAEYLALKAVEVKRADKTLERLERICRRHRKADNRTSALVQKCRGVALGRIGRRVAAVSSLKKALSFFERNSSPVDDAIEAAILLELALLGMFSNNGGHAKAQVRAAVERLRAHVEPKFFFQKDCEALEAMAGNRRGGHDAMKHLIESVVSKVPY